MSKRQVRLYKKFWSVLLPEAHKALSGIAEQIRRDTGKFASEYVDTIGEEFTTGLLVMNGLAPVRELEIRLMCAGLHEGETGVNIKITSYKLVDGKWGVYRGYEPYNYTDACWTADAEELMNRFRGADLSAFALDMVE